MQDIKLNINEIFYSIQGESTTTGIPTVFVRLTGCPLRCNYCDTEYAFKGNNLLTISDIILKVSKYNAKFVCITGGEPLAQTNCLKLLDVLVAKNYLVSLETSGSIDISLVNNKVRIIMDIKVPSSTECDSNKFSNIKYLKEKDEVKFVLANKDDFNWVKNLLTKHNFNCEVLFSPVYGVLKPRHLADWILKNNLNARLQIQLHKLLWGDKRGV